MTIAEQAKMKIGSYLARAYKPAQIDSSITKMCKKIYPTGSRVICDPAPTDTDEDFIVLVDAEHFFDLISELWVNNYELGGSDVTPSEDFAPDAWEGFQSYKKGEINLIVTCSEEFFGKFVLATIMAKNKNLLVKEDRIALSQKILYGEAPITFEEVKRLMEEQNG